MAGWQDLAAPIEAGGPAIAPVGADAAPDWMSLAAPVPPAQQSLTAVHDENLSSAEKSYRAGAEDGGFLGRIHSALGGFTDQAMRMVTGGLSDKAAALAPATAHEIARGVNALYRTVGADHPFPDAEKEDFADIYHKALSQERGAGERYSEQHPVGSKVASTLGAVAAVPLTTGSAVAAAPTMTGRAWQAAKQGATIGGLAGFGQSNDESLGKDALNVGTGVAIGAPLGAATSLIGDVAVKPMVDWVARKFGTKALEDQGVRAIAERVAQSSSAGGPTAQDMLDMVAAAQRAGKPVMLADIGGEPVQGLAERIANTPGAARQQLVSALAGRDVGAGTRLAGDVSEHLAGGASNFETAQALLKARAAASAPLYEKALATEAPVASDRLEQFLADPIFKKGLSQGIQVQRLEALAAGKPFNPSDYAITGFNEAGDPIMSGVPNMRTLDAAKRGLDNILDQYRDSTTGKLALDQTGRAIDQVRRAYVGELDKLNPEYAVARAAYSGPSQSMDALDRGASFAGKSPEQIKADIEALSPNDREFYRLGAANALKTQIAKTSSGGDEARRIVGSDYVQKQIRALSPSDEAAQKLLDAAALEHKMFETGKIAGNSRTALRQGEQAAAHGEGGMAGALAQTAAGALTREPVVSGMGAMNIGRKLLGALSRPNSQVDLTVAKLLSSPDPAQNQRVLAQIIAASRKPSLSGAAVVPLAGLAARTYPSLTQLPFVGKLGGN